MAKAGTAETLLGHVRVNAVADYYDIPQLKELANTKIRHIIETNWSPYGQAEQPGPPFFACRHNQPKVSEARDI